MGEQTHPIKVETDNWRRLNARKEPGDDFDDVVSRLLDKVDESVSSHDPN